MPDGSEIKIKSTAEFEGFKCRLWAPEFHGIMLDSAIRYGKDAEELRRSLDYGISGFDGAKELKEYPLNTSNLFKAMQYAISSIALSISCVESWVNKTIHSEIESHLQFERLNGEAVSWGSNRIEQDSFLAEKLFNVIPSIFGISIIKPHVTARKRFVELISERNTIIHIKNSPKVSGKKVNRNNLALKFLRRNALLVPKNTISIIKLIH